jgi:hypothetical protein
MNPETAESPRLVLRRRTTTCRDLPTICRTGTE